jgi:hypothetical protein
MKPKVGVEEGVEKSEALFIAGRFMRLCCHLWKVTWFLQEPNIGEGGQLSGRALA